MNENTNKQNQDDVQEMMVVFKVAKRMYDRGTSLKRIEEILGLDFSKSKIKL